MVSQRRVVRRTPRRRNLWATFNNPLLDITTGGGPYQFDVLDDTYDDLGLLDMVGITTVRHVGHLAIVGNGGAQTPAVNKNIYVGLAWVDKNTATAASGDSNIPDPLVTGSRDASWIQQWELVVIVPNGTPEVGQPMEPIERTFMPFDITQMRKQPNAGSKLMLVVSDTTPIDDDAVALECVMQTLIKLP